MDGAEPLHECLLIKYDSTFDEKSSSSVNSVDAVAKGFGPVAE
jgi:hypothetical protein